MEGDDVVECEPKETKNYINLRPNNPSSAYHHQLLQIIQSWMEKISFALVAAALRPHTNQMCGS